MASLINSFMTSNNNDGELRSIRKNTSEIFSILQGNTFNKNKSNLQEGFDTNTTSTTTSTDSSSQSTVLNLESNAQSVLNTTEITTDQRNDAVALYEEFNRTLAVYTKLLKVSSKPYDSYFKRVDPKNKYLNKTVRFRSGEVCYVTNQGVARYISTKDIWISSGAPKDVIQLKMSLPNNFWTEGSPIHTKPPLVSGPNLQVDDVVGNEGQNVFVNELIDPNATVTALNTYADNITGSSVMTFPQGTPVTNLITNGNFQNPALSNNQYNTYANDNSSVPSWYFNASLMNNSSAWGYTSYPKGDQAVSIQNKNFISQSISIIDTGTYTLSFYACGRSYKYGTSNPLAVLLSDTSGYSEEFTCTPQVNIWGEFTYQFSIQNSGQYTISITGTNSANSDSSSAVQQVIFTSTSSTDGGSFTWDDCKTMAMNAGYKYFGLQSVDSNTEQGYCGVTNDEVSATSNDVSYLAGFGNVLWSANTGPGGYGPGSYAYMNNVGSLQVFDANGSVIFSTDASKVTNAGFWGCYNDSTTRAIPNWVGNGVGMSSTDCATNAVNEGNKIWGYQYVQNGDTIQCFGGSDMTAARQYGIATNCTTDVCGNIVGGGYSNAVYSQNAGADYFLCVQDDGNLCVYRGQTPSDNQGEIWCSDTSGKQGIENNFYQASNGVFKLNYMVTGQKLEIGQWIGNTDGTVALTMQADGNLVLYAIKKTINQTTLSNGKFGAGQNATFLYEFDTQIIPGNLGKVGYVSADSTLYTYPDSNVTLGDKYTKIADTDSGGSDYKLNGSYISYNNSSVDQCADTCNKYDDCYGYTFQQSSNTCYPKTSGMSYSGTTYSKGVDLYTRNKNVINGIVGSAPIDIDTNSWTNYTQGGDVSSYSSNSVYTLQSSTSDIKSKLSKVENQLKEIVGKIVESTGTFSINNALVQTQVQTDSDTLEDYLKELQQTEKRIDVMGSDGTMKTVVNDTEILVLQKTTNYIILSIIAIALIFILLSVSKK